MSINLPNWTYPAMLFGLLIIAGIAEYLGKLPAGTFESIFFLVLGLIAPSPAFPHQQIITPQANVEASKVDIQSPR